MRLIAKVAGLALLGGSAAAQAAMTGSEFLRLAETDRYSAELYAAGFLDAAAMAQQLKLELPADTRHLPMLVCPPDGAAPRQVVDIILQELRVRPEKRHTQMPVIAWFALAQAWRCDQKP
jgi:hypothetical protein